MRRLLLAAASGSLLAFAFPGTSAAWLAWLAPAPLILLGVTAPSFRRALLEGWSFGLFFHAGVFLWWYDLLRLYGRLSHPEASAVFALLAFYLGAYFALFAAWLRAVSRGCGEEPAILLAPFAWAGLELLKGRLFSGLPWSPLGATQVDRPALIQIASLGGVTLVTFVVSCGAAALAWALLPERKRRAVPILLLCAPAFALLHGVWSLAREGEKTGSLRVGIVQGNVPQEEKWEASARMKILDAHLDATSRAAGQGASLVVWPESSVPLPLTSEPRYSAALESRARQDKVDLLVGSVHYEGSRAEPGRIFNSAFLLPGRDGGTPGQRYDKIHLVPFGEYVPFARHLGFVNRFVVEAGDFTPGTEVRLLNSGGALLGPSICFEAAFGDLVRRSTLAGAQLLVNVTNDAMLRDSAGPRQHLVLARMRAVENGRWMIRAANTGISAVIDAKGRLVRTIPYGEAGEIVEEVPLLEGLTLYATAGDAAGWGCVIVAAASLVCCRIRSGGTSWKRKSSSATQP